MLLDERVLAAVALPDQRRGHCFLHNMSQCDLSVLVSLLTSQRNMSFLFAESTTCLAAFLVLTAKLLVDFNGRTFHLEVAKGAL
jgi:hypothetical protein